MKNMMKKMGPAVLFYIFILRSLVFGQAQTISFNLDESIPLYYYDIISLDSDMPGMTALRIATKIAYDEIQFIKKEEAYIAEYEVSIILLDEQGERTDGKIFRRKVQVDQYDKTNLNDSFDLAQVEFIVPPGTYEVYMSLMDMDSREAGKQRTEIVVNDYKQKPLMISDMVLADHIAVDSTGTRVYVPSVLANFGADQETLFLLYEIYDRTGRDSIRVNLTIRDSEDDVLRTLERFKTLAGVRTIDVIEIPRGELKTGRYRLELSAGEGEIAIRKRRDFSVHWIGMPVFARNIDMAIEQMKYIANRKQMRTIQKAEGAEKERLFREFWDSKDPTQQSATNELMDEYYRRVAFSNRSFTTFRDGWKTDRGMVYIILGPPDEIVRRPFNQSSKPYVVWAYYRYNREFIFLDDTGYGEYRLMSPFWDLVNRIQ